MCIVFPQTKKIIKTSLIDIFEVKCESVKETDHLSHQQQNISWDEI